MNEITLPEPFKIKMVESIKLSSRSVRERLVKEAGYNVFMLKIDDIFIDLLTDSGTSAMSDSQWSGMLTTKQAYAGTDSYYTLEKTMKKIFGFKFFVPVHQGRAAENILFSTMVSTGKFVPSNMHFDTTEANIMKTGGIPVNLAIDDAYDTTKIVSFKGNMDTVKLENFIHEKGAENIPMIMITVTNNTGGGQPVSMENIRNVSAIARKHKIPFFIDACRFAENSYFIKKREAEYSDKSVVEISREMFSYADGCTFSGKKEALTNIGGMLCTNNEDLHLKFKNLLIVIEGFPTYGGLACRELEAMSRGLHEVIECSYQEYRHAQLEKLADILRRGGVPIVEPIGGHAIYIDAAKFLPHVPHEQFSAQALTAQLYIESGVRAVELGSSCFGKFDEEGNFIPPKLELMRLAIPRRVYTDNHLRYVAEHIVRLHKNRENIHGLRRTYAPKLLGHFTARFEPV